MFKAPEFQISSIDADPNAMKLVAKGSNLFELRDYSKQFGNMKALFLEFQDGNYHFKLKVNNQNVSFIRQ